MGTVCRVFGSQSEMERSPYWSGSEDLLKNEPGGATHGVWPGKHNIGRFANKQPEFWITAPVHPGCGHSLVDYDPTAEQTRHEDWYQELLDRDLKKLTQ